MRVCKFGGHVESGRDGKNKQNQRTGENLVNATMIERLMIDGRALDCRAGGRGFDSRGRTNT